MDTKRIGQSKKQHRTRKIKQKQTTLKEQIDKYIKAILILLGIISKLENLFNELEQEQLQIELRHNATLPDFYIHNRNKRFIQASSLVSEIIGTFMGALNACEIQQLKSKCLNLSQVHNMLVQITQQHDKDINQMKQELKSIVDVIDSMAKYKPGLLQQQISKQLDMFEDQITVITSTTQQITSSQTSC